MRQIAKLTLVRLLLVCIGFATTRSTVSAGSHFVAPVLTAASDIPYPFDNIASGLVSLAVIVDPGGHVQSVQVVRHSRLDGGSDERRENVELHARQDGWEPSRVHNQCSSSLQSRHAANPGFATAAWGAGYASSSCGIHTAGDGSGVLRCLPSKQCGDVGRSARSAGKQVQRSEKGDAGSLGAVVDGVGNRFGEDVDRESIDDERKENGRGSGGRVCVPCAKQFNAVGIVSRK